MDNKLTQLEQWIEKGELEQALHFCENNSENFQNSCFYNLQGVLFWKLEEFDLAEICFKQALILDPEYTDAKTNLNFFYTQCGEEIIIDTDNCASPKEGSNIYDSRRNVVNALLNTSLELSIGVLAYNRYEKTKACVDSIIKYTDDLEYQLILVDHGSDDERILAYFRSVPHKNKKIVRVTKNMESVYAGTLLQSLLNTKYCLTVASDVIITENAIQNLLICLKSDLKIGCVIPVSSNVSNLQEVNFDFSNEEEMQAKAKCFNTSNPLLWEERLRIVPQLLFHRKECAYTAGMLDPGFFHDFADDDYSYRLRHSGYKTILCKDAWVHHNHDFRNAEDKQSTEKFYLSMTAGKQKFKEKHFGIDAWDDLNNFEIAFMHMVSAGSPYKSYSVLGVDVLCGTPILELKNKLRKSNCLNVALSAFTEDAKYYHNLQTICEQVACDRIDYICEKLDGVTYDYILVGKELNTYKDMLTVLASIKKLSKVGTQILVKLQNTNDWLSLLKQKNLSIDNEANFVRPFAKECTVEQFCEICKQKGLTVNELIKINDIRVDSKGRKRISAQLEKVGIDKTNLTDAYIQEYCFMLTLS